MTGDALDIDQIAKHLPPAEQQAREADYLERMFDHTTRAGAGGTKAGLVGLRPSGSTAAFHERYTGSGRLPKPPEEKGITFGRTEKRNDSAKPHKIELPMTFCLDCGADCGNPAGIDFGWFDQNTSEAMGIKAGELVVGFIGFGCFTRRKNKEKEQKLYYVKNGQETDSFKEWLDKRRERMLKHTIEYVAAQRAANNDWIYVDKRGKVS